jgi:hypothetical protein
MADPATNIQMQIKTNHRTDQERFNLLLSSVRGSAVADLLHECALCDLVLVSEWRSAPDDAATFETPGFEAPEFVRCQHCKLHFCRECVVSWGTCCPICYEEHYLKRGSASQFSQFSHEDLVKLCGSARKPKTRELLNPGDSIEVAEFAASESESGDEDESESAQ